MGKESLGPHTREVNSPNQAEKLLTELADKLNETAGPGNWAIIGGVARALYREDRVPPDIISPSPETRRDVDILLIPPGGVKPSLVEEILRNAPPPLRVGMSFHHRIIRKPNNHKDKFFAIGSRGTWSVNLPSEAFEIVFVRCLPTLTPGTLFHLYCLGRWPEGKMRPKDFLNALEFARTIRLREGKVCSPIFRPFHDFAHRSLREGEDPLLQWLYHLVDLLYSHHITDINRHPRVRALAEWVVWLFTLRRTVPLTSPEEWHSLEEANRKLPTAR